MSSTSRSASLRIGLGIALLLGGGGLGAFFSLRGGAKAETEPETASEGGKAIAVKVIHPTLSDAYRILVDRPVSVAPYYQNNIEAQVSGLVNMIRVAPGSRVTKGEELVKIAVPDLKARLDEARALFEQRESEKLLAQKQLAQAKVAVDTAKKKEVFKQAALRVRQAEHDRDKRLWEARAIDHDLYDQAIAALDTARAAYEKAKSEVEEAGASFKHAQVEVRVKGDLVEVARAQRDQAEALLGFATIHASFPAGYIVERKVDPFSLVQNASNSGGHPTPILTLERTDIVTVVMQVPDNYARFTNQDTEAILELDNLPGLKIHGKVTRYTKSLENEQSDKTMKVEVDLWNGSAAAYEKAIQDPSFLSDLKEIKLDPAFAQKLRDQTLPTAEVKMLKEGRLPANAIQQSTRANPTNKSRVPQLPQLPRYSGTNFKNASPQLLPGMYGKMTLVLEPTRRLIPSKALVREAGQAYIYVAEHGKARKLRVEVRVEDEHFAYVVRLNNEGEALGQLPADMDVIVTELDQMNDDQEIKTSALGDWSQLDAKKDKKPAASTENEGEDNSVPISVNVVQPTEDSSFQLTMDRPVTARPYYKNLIEAQVSGLVEEIHVDNGSRVTEGEVLVRIAVPDLDAKVKEAEALQRQSVSAKALAEERVEQLALAIHTALANEKEKEALVALRRAQRNRYEELYSTRSIDYDVYAQSRASYDAAVAEQQLAHAEVEDAKAARETAAAEVPVKENLIKVADAQLKLARVLRSFATIRAHFDGYIRDRKVDPNSLVHNASNGGGQATPILTLERTDLITVVMRVPDNFAAFINQDTEAILELDNLPGLKIHGKVTRYTKSLENEQQDKTMRVEVDLWNGTAEAYEKAMQDLSFLRQLKEWSPRLKPWNPKDKSLDEQIKEWQQQGWDPPLMPNFTGENTNKNPTRLKPGDYGKMTLVLKKFPPDTRLIPSQAIVRETSQNYIYLVEKGKAHKVRVDVQLEDGNFAYVLRTGKEGEVLGPLAADTKIIVTNQEELSEGQPVKTTLVKMTRKDRSKLKKKASK